MDPFHLLETKVRQLPHDQGGSVLLLSGMMAFLITIMALYAVDTSQVVYHRITAQNAADAAAEAAALEQARGLNLIQELNNDHYLFNMTLFGIEMYHLVVCLETVEAASDAWGCCSDPFCWAACAGAWDDAVNKCETCSKALDENKYQARISKLILDTQQGLSYIFPLLEWAYASQAAQRAGADPVVHAFGDWMSSFISTIFPSFSGFSVPSLPGELASLEPYAFPLNLSSLSLNIKKENGGYWPWRWSFFNSSIDEWIMKTAASVAWDAASVACLSVFSPISPEGISPTAWGWRDQYFEGHPGYMTWVAGKTNQTELAGLGNIRWLNPNPSPPAEVSYWMNQSNLPMYNGASTGSSALQIPAVIAFASSQVEGTGVIAVDESLLSEIEAIIGGMSSVRDFTGVVSALGPAIGHVPVDSTPHLISVYLPFLNDASGTDIYIYH